MQLLQLFSPGNSNYSHHGRPRPLLLTTHACIILTHWAVIALTFTTSSPLNAGRPIQDVLSSEETVYVGDVTFN